MKSLTKEEQERIDTYLPGKGKGRAMAWYRSDNPDNSVAQMLEHFRLEHQESTMITEENKSDCDKVARKSPDV